jgi:hypothetical protein
MKSALLLSVTLISLPLAAGRAADAPEAKVGVTQELRNSISIRPQLIRDPFPAYADKFLPFAMAASMESTQGGRLWTCWAGGQHALDALPLHEGYRAELFDRRWQDLAAADDAVPARQQQGRVPPS